MVSLMSPTVKEDMLGTLRCLLELNKGNSRNYKPNGSGIHCRCFLFSREKFLGDP